MFSVTIPSITPPQNTPVLPNMRRTVMRPSGASCSHRNAAKSGLAVIASVGRGGPRGCNAGRAADLHDLIRERRLAAPQPLQVVQQDVDHRILVASRL